MLTTDRFKQLTNYDIITFLNDFNYFVNNYYSYIVSYYEGSYSPNKKAFYELNRLIKEANKVEDIFSINSNILSETTEFWDLLDDFTNVKGKLETIRNTPKWIRSSYVYGYDANAKTVVNLKQHQTLESLSDELGDLNPNDDWVNHAIDNYIQEVDYDIEGGNSLIVSKYNNRKMNTEGVVDIMINDNILGKDLNKKLTIINDDWNYLTPINTLKQAAEYYLTLFKNSVPEFPNKGIPKELIGGNMAFIRSASLWRHLTEIFKTDKSFKKIQLINTKISQDSAFYDIKLVSILNNELNETIPINP